MLLLTTAAIAGARLVTPPYAANCQAPAWSPDGSRLSYEVNDHEQKTIELYIYTPGEGQPAAVTPLARGSSASLTAGFSTSAAEQVTHELSWSPSALNTFVYSASGAGQDYDLYIHQGGAVGAAPGADGGPAWSPDGRWIVFTSARTGQGDLYLLDVHNLTAPARRLTTDPTAAELYAAWSPDGRELVYVGHSDDGDRIYSIADLEQPIPQERTNLGRTQTRPSYSPDGSRLAFYSNHREVGEFDLYVTTHGHAPEVVAHNVVLNHRGPVWTPDGERLIYVLSDDERYNPIYIAAVDGSQQPRRLESKTVGNQDLSVVRGQDGQTWLALSAQGMSDDTVRDFKRIYVMAIPD